MRIAVELPKFRGQFNRSSRQILNRLSGFAVLILTQGHWRNRARINMDQARALNHAHSHGLGKFFSRAERGKFGAHLRHLPVFGGDFAESIQDFGSQSGTAVPFGHFDIRPQPLGVQQRCGHDAGGDWHARIGDYEGSTKRSIRGLSERCALQRLLLAARISPHLQKLQVVAFLPWTEFVGIHGCLSSTGCTGFFRAVESSHYCTDRVGAAPRHTPTAKY